MVPMTIGFPFGASVAGVLAALEVLAADEPASSESLPPPHAVRLSASANAATVAVILVFLMVLSSIR
jgi:hypothetical protein